MYESYWNLNENPFENTADPRFFFPGENFQGTLLKVRYAVEERKGAAMVCGGFGCGKTLLVSTLVQQLDSTISPVIRIVFPQMGPEELLAYVAEEMLPTTTAGGNGSNGHGSGLHHTVKKIDQFVQHNAARGRHTLIVVDEAHLIQDRRTFETLRLLLNFEYDNHYGVTVLLVGQPALLTAMERMNQFEERLAVKCVLRCLTAEETVGYITHRLTVAGGSPDIFEPEAISLIYELAGGVPRRINRICDLSMLMSYANETETIGPDQVMAVGEELATVAPE
jgi:type II secretory pathway predicted ATPase ExeA